MSIRIEKNNVKEDEKRLSAHLVFVNENGKMDELINVRKDAEKVLQFGSYEHDLVSGQVKWSNGVYEIFGYPDSDNAINYNTFLSHLTDKEDFVDAINSDADTKIAEYTREYEIQTRNHAKKVIKVFGKLLYNDKGELYKDVGIIRDITREREQEDIINNAISELQRSNRELEEFAYVASHDLQEPLRKISTFSDRLADKYADILSGDGALYLDRIMASAQNMRTLIDNLLEFSRISKPTQPFAPVNLNFVLNQVKADLELVIDETDTVITSMNLPTINASLTQMQQLFTNLINNSIKFKNPDIAPVIKIDARELSNDEKQKHRLLPSVKYYRVELADNGIGFENEYANRIFQVFQRLHGKSEYPGSGIGLAICKKILERHHGIIYAEGATGKGARFIFIIPEEQPQI